MSLSLISTPIGNYGDITLRAIEALKKADVIICEEIKPASILLKKTGVGEKKLLQLNEHSKPHDLKELMDACRTQNVALITDCGTPGFCDPGADLVAACIKENISMDVLPGASSLMSLITLSGIRLDEFFFVGFLPAENQAREKKLADVSKLKTNLIVMDTPYRLNRTLQDFAKYLGAHKCVLGMDLTGREQKVERGFLNELAQNQWPKLPFVLLIKGT